MEGMQQELAYSLLGFEGGVRSRGSLLSSAAGSELSVASSAPSLRQAPSSREAFINALLTARAQLLEEEGVSFVRQGPSTSAAWPSPAKGERKVDPAGKSETREEWEVAQRWVGELREGSDAWRARLCVCVCVGRMRI